MSPLTDIVLVDDHPLLAAGLRASLVAEGLSLVAAPALDHDDILAFIKEQKPRLAILDHSIPPLGVSTDLIAPIRDLDIPVVILTGSIDDALWGSLVEAGALGVLGKDEPMDDLVNGIVDILAGRRFRPTQASQYLEAWRSHQRETEAELAPFRSLSHREALVLQSLVNGSTPAEIAAADFVSTETVRSQLKSAFRKLHVSSQLEAAALVHATGWTAPVHE